MPSPKIAILGGARTAVGRYGGILSKLPTHQLGIGAVKASLERTGVKPQDIDEVIMGCIGQVGPEAYNARQVAIGSGLGDGVPAFTVNRLCGSGLQAIWSAAQQISWGGTEFAIAGGNESMSNMPFLDFNARNNGKLGNRTLIDGTLAMLTDPFSGQHMGVTAENVATRYGISRQEQDEFALESQRRATTPQASAAMAEEITPLEVGDGLVADHDEHPRPETTIESLAALNPAFSRQGSVTAGNSSGINDGGAAVVLSTTTTAAERGLEALATIEHVTTAAMDPALMGYAPTLALRKLFNDTRMGPADIDVVELNEAFAAQAVAVARDTGLDPQRMNPYGGAIARGHPVGATGAILTLRAAMDLRRRDLEYGVITMCIGGGQALAALIKRHEH